MNNQTFRFYTQFYKKKKFLVNVIIQLWCFAQLLASAKNSANFFDFFVV